MRPLPGVRVTMIARELHTPYSGMIPGLVAGYFTYDQVHIDLGPLAAAAGARLIEGEVTGLDLARGEAQLGQRPGFRYDVLSLDCGAVPLASDVVIEAPIIPAKPIGRFIQRWKTLLGELECAVTAGRSPTVAVVGGGAGGVELTLSIERAMRMRRLPVRTVLVNDGDELLMDHGSRVRRHLANVLAARGVPVHNSFRVTRVTESGLQDASGEGVPAGFVLWVTGAGTAPWPRAAGLATDAGGFVRVRETLQSVSHPEVFATGDMVSLDGQPRPKSGVFAVREGPTLAENLYRAFDRRPLRRYRAQRRALALISEGDAHATLSRGRLFAHGAWVWRWKNWIDLRFMARFDVRPSTMPSDTTALPSDLATDLPDPMQI